MYKILVVEDDASISELISSVLQESGFTVFVTKSAEEAKTQISVEKPSLAIVDIMLPGQGGMDFILELRSSHPSLGIILTSGKIDMNKTTFKLLASQFGVLSVLPKPFTIEELIKTVTEAFEKIKTTL